MPDLPSKMIVCAGRKRSLRALNDVEVEVISQSDESCLVTCRRCDDGKLVKLRRSLLKPTPPSDPMSATDTSHRLRDEQQQWMARLRTEILDLEDLIPWNGVIKSWKTKRGSWRKRIMASLTLQDLGEGLKELLRCLVWEKDNRLGHSILKWESEIDDMCSEPTDYKKFSKLWKRLSGAVHQWIRDSATGTHLPEPAVSRRRAEMALHRLKDAMKEGEASLSQVPLDAILHDDVAALGHLKSMLSAEKRRQLDVTSPGKKQADAQSAERSVG